MKSIIVCDDEPFTLNMFSEMIEKIFIKYNVEAEISCKASAPGEIREYINKNPKEYLIFMDLDLGKNEINGLDLSYLLKKSDLTLKIVFVTSHTEKGIDILKSGIEPFGFIEKSLNKSFIEKEFYKYIRLFAKQDKENVLFEKRTISIPVGIDEIIDLEIDRIAYVEAVKSVAHNICYHTIEGSQITVRDTISHATALLGENFELSHRSVLVNKNVVIGLESGMLKLSNGMLVACAAGKRKIFVKKGR
nr:response regulator [uncultured Clostridium sp.]